MKKILSFAVAFTAMFAVSFSASAEENTTKEEEKVEIKASEESASKAQTEEIDEVTIYQRTDGSVYIVHTHTMQVKN
ncbi:MAG: hypothetical protein J5663_04615 [Bacteroidaceae bacterium]|jgi:hypothetical protein|nr:hypothetical protein [Bacteroidaceae bacterium]